MFLGNCILLYFPLNFQNFPVFGKQRQVDLCKLEASLVYILSFRIAELHSKTMSPKKTKNYYHNKTDNDREAFRTSYAIHCFQLASYFTDAARLRPATEAEHCPMGGKFWFRLSVTSTCVCNLCLMFLLLPFGLVLKQDFSR